MSTKLGCSRGDNLTVYQIFYSVMNRSLYTGVCICDTDMAVIFRVFDESKENLGKFPLFWMRFR